MKELIQALSNQGIITVVDIQRMTTLELLLTIIERVNELHGLTKEGLEAVQRLLDKGVQEEVIAQFDEWLQDGTFDKLINQSALKEVNKRIDETNAQLSQNKQELSDKIQEVATTGTTTEVLQATTVSYINEKINDGTIANLTIEDYSLTSEKFNPNSLSVSMIKEKNVIENLFNKNLIHKDFTLQPNGNMIQSQDRFTTGFINIEQGKEYNTNFSAVCLYDKNRIFTRKVNAYSFTPEYNEYYFRGSLSTSTLDSAFLKKGNEGIIDYKYKYSLDGHVLTDDENKRLNDLYSDIQIKDTIKNIEITSSTNGMNITLFGLNSNYNNTFYAYRDGELIKTFKTDTQTTTYTLKDWQLLIWNLTTNTIEVVNDNKKINNAVILANYSVNGVGGEGYLINRFAFINNLQPKGLNTHIKVTDLYLCNGEDAHVKFKSLLITRGDYYKTFDYEKVSSDLSDYLRQSKQWVKDCIMIKNGFQIVLDTKTDKFIMNTLGNNFTDNHIILAWNNNGEINGLLAEAWEKLMMDRIYPTSNTINPEWLETIENKENEILSVKTDDMFTFTFSTDMHVQEWERRHVNSCYTVMNHVIDSVNVDCIINGGDSICYGQPTKYTGFGALKDAMRKYKHKEKVLHVVGNHDSNIISDALVPLGDKKQRPEWILSQQEIYNILGSHLKDSDVVWGSKEGMYFYKDYNKQKIRVVCLNTTDVPYDTGIDSNGEYYKYVKTTINGIQQEQAQWLADVALKFNKADKSEWHTIIVFHLGLYTIEQGFDWNGIITNAYALRQIIMNFKNGVNSNVIFNDTIYDGVFNLNVNCQFEEQGEMVLVGTWSGHNHLDCMVTIDGYNALTTTCGYPDQNITDSEKGDRIPFEYNEFAFDYVLVDKNNRKVMLKRFGFGEDREFNY